MSDAPIKMDESGQFVHTLGGGMTIRLSPSTPLHVWTEEAAASLVGNTVPFRDRELLGLPEGDHVVEAAWVDDEGYLVARFRRAEPEPEPELEPGVLDTVRAARSESVGAKLAAAFPETAGLNDALVSQKVVTVRVDDVQEPQSLELWTVGIVADKGKLVTIRPVAGGAHNPAYLKFEITDWEVPGGTDASAEPGGRHSRVVEPGGRDLDGAGEG